MKIGELEILLDEYKKRYYEGESEIDRLKLKIEDLEQENKNILRELNTIKDSHYPAQQTLIWANNLTIERYQRLLKKHGIPFEEVNKVTL